LLIVGEFLALCWLLYGMWRLHTTLNPKEEVKQAPKDKHARALPMARAAALPAQSAHASVTEGTTELLATPERERVAASAGREKTDTAEMR
ncbi:MAG: hypothetical protein LC672_03675, partial [Acidobacteria bacterium]|nr:hypothetical protein [Acidobacteriota bacterium]